MIVPDGGRPLAVAWILTTMNMPDPTWFAGGGDWQPGDGSATDRLWLSDWRRRTTALYAEIRQTSRVDRQVALAHWRAVRESMYRTHPQSPVPPAERATYQALHFPSDGSMRYEVRVQPAPEPPTGLGDGMLDALARISLPNSGANTLSFSRIGSIELPLVTGTRRLTVFWMAGYAGGLFIPFRDATNGIETYDAGRYLLDAAKGLDLGGDPAAGTIVVDFDYAIQPSCAFDPRWACPLAPPENRLDIPIRAGERLR
jgi:uncharacterized protein (DUF1684 family)